MFFYLLTMVYGFILGSSGHHPVEVPERGQEEVAVAPPGPSWPKVIVGSHGNVCTGRIEKKEKHILKKTEILEVWASQVMN